MTTTTPNKPKPSRDKHTKAELLDLPVNLSRTRTPPSKVTQLARLGIETPRDLLYHFPRSYEDHRFMTPIADAQVGEKQTFQGILTPVVSFQNHRMQSATLYSSYHDYNAQKGGIPVTWFNQRYLAHKIAPATPVRLSGKVNFTSGRRIGIMHPEIEYLTNIDDPVTQGILPVYPATAGMSQEYLRNITTEFLETFEEVLPRAILRDNEVPASLHTLLHAIHFPTHVEWVDRARYLVTRDEVLELQLALIERRRLRDAQAHQVFIKVKTKPRKHMLDKLPFKPSNAQLRCMDEIRADLTNPGPTMNRLLHGETGSGKTVVALAAILDVASAELQSTLLAPTELLAEQHFRTLSSLLDTSPADNPSIQTAIIPGLRDQRFTMALLTGSTTARQRRTILGQAQLGIIDLLVGTHAIIQDDVDLPKLGLAIADEQHRFGTAQRAVLRAGANYLMLTATPIPRTLQLTLYRDLDVSTIDEMPTNRQPVDTTLLTPFERGYAHHHIRQEIDIGRQAFVVCPLIEPSTEIPDASVEEQAALITRAMPDARVQIIHGRLKQAQQDKIMASFRDHQTDILIATSVIEVGIDIPNATVMLIEAAERFGMAQLHQFRGRIGRGEHPGSCYLTTSPAADPQPHTMERLQTVAASSDGMELAIADLRHRGSGQIGGSRQSGRSSLLRTGNDYDIHLLEEQRDLAQAIADQDPNLALPQHQILNAARTRFLGRFDYQTTDH